MKKDGRIKITRGWLLAAVGVAVIVLPAGIAIDALVLEPHSIRVTYPVIKIKDLPPSFDGLRIAHLTDMHLGRFTGIDQLLKAVELANSASPDLIVITGDFVNSAKFINPALTEALKKLQGVGGKFAVLGNHDHWTNPSAIEGVLSAAGITMLTNTHIILRRGEEAICIAGVDDLWTGQQLLESALTGIGKDVPRIVLCHNPDYADQMPPSPRVDLLLCGHSHGGQVKIPFGPRPILPIDNPKYAAGLAQGPHCQVYTSCGLGMIGIPVRFNCRPELPIITLRRA